MANIAIQGTTSSEGNPLYVLACVGYLRKMDLGLHPLNPRICLLKYYETEEG